MSLQEEIEEKARSIFPVHNKMGRFIEDNKECRLAFEMGANFMLEKAFEWIPVDKELPALSEKLYYIAAEMNDGEYICMSIFSKDDIDFLAENAIKWNYIHLGDIK